MWKDKFREITTSTKSTGMMSGKGVKHSKPTSDDRQEMISMEPPDNQLSGNTNIGDVADEEMTGQVHQDQ